MIRVVDFFFFQVKVLLVLGVFIGGIEEIKYGWEGEEMWFQEWI